MLYEVFVQAQSALDIIIGWRGKSGCDVMTEKGHMDRHCACRWQLDLLRSADHGGQRTR